MVSSFILQYVDNFAVRFFPTVPCRCPMRRTAVQHHDELLESKLAILESVAEDLPIGKSIRDFNIVADDSVNRKD